MQRFLLSDSLTHAYDSRNIQESSGIVVHSLSAIISTEQILVFLSLSPTQLFVEALKLALSLLLVSQKMF